MISQLPPELVTQIIEISIPTCRPCDNLDYINQITTRYSYLKNYSLVNTIWQDIATEKLVEMIWLRRSYTSAKELGRLLNRNEGYMASKVKNLWIGSGASMVDLPIMNRLEELWYQIHGIPSLEWLSQATNLRSLSLLSERTVPHGDLISIQQPLPPFSSNENVSTSLQRLSFDPGEISISDARILTLPNLTKVSVYIKTLDPEEVLRQYEVIAILSPKLEQLQLFQSYIPENILASLNTGFKRFHNLRSFTTNNLNSLSLLLQAIPTPLESLRLLDQNNSFSAPLNRLLTQLKLLPPCIQELKRIGIPSQWSSYSWKQEVSAIYEWCESRGINVVICKTVGNIRGQDLDLMEW